MVRIICLAVCTLLITRCGTELPPAATARGAEATVQPQQDIQEGIGGDLAALYVKGITLTNLSMGEEDKYPVELQANLERDVENVALFSVDGQDTLFAWRGKTLLVDRQALSTVPTSTMVDQLIEKLGYSVKPTISQEFKLKPVTFDLPSLAKEAQRLVEVIIGQNQDFPVLPEELLGERSEFSQTETVKVVARTLPQMKFQESDAKLIDAKSKLEVDAITKVDKKKNRVVLVSKNRVRRVPGLMALLPILLVHEATHGCHRELPVGDETYALTHSFFKASGNIYEVNGVGATN